MTRHQVAGLQRGVASIATTLAVWCAPIGPASAAPPAAPTAPAPTPSTAPTDTVAAPAAPPTNATDRAGPLPPTAAPSAAPTAAPAADPITTLLAGSTDAAGRRCEPHARHGDGDRLLIACGAAGVWDLRRDSQGGWRLAHTYDVGGEAVGLFTDPDGTLWVKTLEIAARPLTRAAAPRLAPAAPAIAPPEPVSPGSGGPAAPSNIPVGRVLAYSDGAATISLGSTDLIRRGTRIELSEDRTVTIGTDQMTDSVVLGVGEVVAVSPNHATVEVGMNERIPVGATATPTGSPKTGSNVAPPRASGFWQFESMVRPFVAIDQFGGGVLLDASLGYRFESKLRLAAMVVPIGVGDADGSDAAGVATGLVLASYDSKFLEMGAGLGAQTVNDTQFDIEPGSGLLVAQLARVGAVDGLNLTARTTIVLFHREFDLGSLDIAGQIPVGRGYWLLLGGGGGPAGYGYGEIGLRALLSGNGDRTSTYIKTTAGGAGVFRSDGCTETSFGFECGLGRTYAGPMVGFGVEQRF